MKFGYIISAALFLPSLALAQKPAPVLPAAAPAPLAALIPAPLPPIAIDPTSPSYVFTAGVQTDAILMDSQRGDGYYFGENHYLDVEFIKSNDMFDGYLYIKLIGTDITDAYATMTAPMGVGVTAGKNIFDYTSLESNLGLKAFYTYKLTEKSEVQVGLFTANSKTESNLNLRNTERPFGIGAHYLMNNTKVLVGYGMENKVRNNVITGAFEKQSWTQIKVGAKQDTLDKKLIGEAYIAYTKSGIAKTITPDEKKINVFKDGDNLADTEKSSLQASFLVDGYSSYFGISSLLRTDDTLTYHAKVQYDTMSEKRQDPANPTDLTKKIDYKPSNTLLEVGGGWRVGGFFTGLNFGVAMASDCMAPSNLGLANYENGSDKTSKNVEDATQMPYGGLGATDDDGLSKTATQVTWSMGYDF